MYIDNEGNSFFYEYLNCTNKGVTINDVLRELKYKSDEETEWRILNYRKFGKYFSFDNYGLKKPCN